jgi:hypothetical protein
MILFSKNFFFSVIIILFLGVLAVPRSAEATPFGGIVAEAIWCNCSLNWLIIYAPVRPGTMPKALSYRPGVSTLYSYYQILKPGAWVLGTTVGPDPCVMGGECEIHINFSELIQIVGTSR